jgi:ankyrin repeat protein
MHHFRPKTLIQLKINLWNNAFNSNDGLFGDLWSELLDGSQGTCQKAVHHIKTQSFAAEDFERSNVLPFAAYRGWGEVVGQLLQVPDGLHCRSSAASRALCEAIQADHFQTVDIILGSGLDINSTASPVSFLAVAVSTASKSVVEYLLGKGAHPMTPCQTFGNAMLAVCHHNQPIAYPSDLLCLLLKHEGDPNLVVDGGNTLLQVAKSSSSESLQTAKALVEAGVDCNAPGDRLGTAVLAAATSRSVALVAMLEMLHRAGAKVDSSALVAAADRQSFKSEEKIWKLIGWGAGPSPSVRLSLFVDAAARHPDPNVRSLGFIDNIGYHTYLQNQALLDAAAVGNIDTMIDLIERGADVNAQGELSGAYTTPLVAAICSPTMDNAQKVQLLILHGANVHVPVGRYANVLQMHLDYKDPSPAIVLCLLNSGVDASDPSGPAGEETAMEIALRRGQQDCYLNPGWHSIIILLHRAGAVLGDEGIDC